MINNPPELPELPKLNHGPVDLKMTNGANGRQLFMQCNLDDFTASKEKLETLRIAFAHREALRPRPLYGPTDWEFLDFEANHQLNYLARRVDFPLPYGPERIVRVVHSNGGKCFKTACNTVPTVLWKYKMVSICMCCYMLLNSVNRLKKLAKSKWT